MTNKTNNLFLSHRDKLIEWVRSQLIGPGPYESGSTLEDSYRLKTINPIDRFPCGALYPIFQGEGEDPASISVEESGLTEHNDKPHPEDDTEDTEFVPRFTPPSSMGISFYVTGDLVSFEVNPNFVYYKLNNGWERTAFNEQSENFRPFYSPKEESSFRDSIEIMDKAQLYVLWRRFADGWIVTVSLCNLQQMDKQEYSTSKEFTEERAEKTLFEANFNLLVTAGEIGDYPRINMSLLDEEEHEIELQYGKSRVYAIGHGAGADWELEKNGHVKLLRTNSMPLAEVPYVTAEVEKSDILRIEQLSRFSDSKENLLADLSDFVCTYEAWMKSQEKKITDFTHHDLKAAGSRIINRIQTVINRMRMGIKLLDADDEVRLAFALANQAMLLQMQQVNIVNGVWRPFQLAFLLTVLESTANGDSDFRDFVDLIWFPTGGGKTEAYLGMIAFVILLRRLKYPQSYGGTTALMRYTFRLLTKDQFLRAARLICALELMRQERDDLGDLPITIGMWVGKEVSPNYYKDASALVDTAKNAGTEPTIVMNSCPWCGQPFKVASGNYDSSELHFNFRCKNQACDFGRQDKPLPCNVVDEHLYENPPTFLVSTIDKFARLAWEERCKNFFGVAGNRPPELIIQDELHLISGPLGSISGLYEASLDSIIKYKGVFPKYIASTATIHSAAEQIKRLYGRKMAVFPPPGLDSDDSYFARSVSLDERPGRLYIGYLAPLLNRQKCLAPLAATLLCAPLCLFADQIDEDLLFDAWWTMVVYHGSLKGVANSQLSFDTDVRDYMRILIKEYKQSLGKTESETDESRHKIFEKLNLRLLAKTEQLTSRIPASETARIFSNLNIASHSEDCIDAALATNMISVGLDVGRLALMIVNGQPLTTAEYIQASSRVGRRDIPGIIFTNYYRDQARSLSHYELFKPYHEAFYRFVEPTSVTPYTWQARDRALHAALISVMRHACSIKADSFDPTKPECRKAIELFKRRCCEAGCESAVSISEHVDQLVERWVSQINYLMENKRKLVYWINNDKAYDNLIYNFDEKVGGVWPTLQSMRNVEKSSLVKEL